MALEDEGKETVEVLGESDDSPASSRTRIGNLEHVVDESVDSPASCQLLVSSFSLRKTRQDLKNPRDSA